MTSLQEYDQTKRQMEEEIQKTDKLVNEKQEVYHKAREPFQKKLNDKNQELMSLMTPLRQKYSNFREYVEYSKEVGLNIQEERIKTYEAKLEEEFQKLAAPLVEIEKEMEKELKTLADDLNEHIRKVAKLKAALKGAEEFEST